MKHAVPSHVILFSGPATPNALHGLFHIVGQSQSVESRGLRYTHDDARIAFCGFGKLLIATRDAETRTRFLGYRPEKVKLFVWTLSAVMAGIAGALYVPQVGIINPGEFAPANSIEIVIWTAVGGRGTIIGPVIGAFLVNGGKSVFTGWFPEYWLFVLGALFVLTTLLLPKGIVGALADGWKLRKRKKPQEPSDAVPQAAE